jgi:hypothetical protein
MVICRVTEFARVLQSRGKKRGKIEMAVFPSWFEGLAVALHPLQPDSLFCFSCLVLN